MMLAKQQPRESIQSRLTQSSITLLAVLLNADLAND